MHERSRQVGDPLTHDFKVIDFMTLRNLHLEAAFLESTTIIELIEV